MSNSSINISNYSPASLKDKNQLINKVSVSSSRTADTWYTLLSKSIEVQASSSGKVEVNISIGVCPAGNDLFIRLLRDGSQISAFTAASPSARTTATQGIARPNTSTFQQMQTLYYVDTGLSAGTYTYAIQILADVTTTVPINRHTTEAATTARNVAIIDLAEL